MAGKGKVVLVHPGTSAQIVEMDLSLKNMQKTVGGLIQAVYPFDDPVCLVCNDEGKLEGLPPNRVLIDEDGMVSDIIAGTFFICGIGEDDLTGLSDEMAEKYKKYYRNPQFFMMENGKINVIELEE